MTEEEAKTKWCPFIIGMRVEDRFPCIGSACMAWRENAEENSRFSGGRCDHGFCGLAGRP